MTASSEYPPLPVVLQNFFIDRSADSALLDDAMCTTAEHSPPESRITPRVLLPIMSTAASFRMPHSFALENCSSRAIRREWLLAPRKPGDAGTNLCPRRNRQVGTCELFSSLLPVAWRAARPSRTLSLMLHAKSDLVGASDYAEDTPCTFQIWTPSGVRCAKKSSSCATMPLPSPRTIDSNPLEGGIGVFQRANSERCFFSYLSH